MTEPLPAYRTDLSEAEIQREVVKHLRDAGWVVTVFATPSRKYKQERDWPDVVASADDTTLLLELKKPTGRLTPGQLEFRAKVTPLLGPHLHYRVVRYVADVAEWL